MGLRIEVSKEQVAAFCERYGVVELAFFGSVLRDDFGPESDIDVLVRFHPDFHRDFAVMQTMREELSEILGRDADLVPRVAVEDSRNYIRRNSILQSAEVFYDAPVEGRGSFSVSLNRRGKRN